MKIKRITNENLNVEEKVNYFIDRYSHYLEYAGSDVDYELENQLSLVQKINFQLSHDKEYRLDYIDNYFNHRIFKIKEIWEDYLSFPNVEKQLALYWAISTPTKAYKEIRSQKTNIIDSSIFQNNLKDLEIELEHKMPSILYEQLLSVIQCRFSLKEDDHIQKLNLLAQLIVSAGYFTGKKYTEINELINRIFVQKAKFPYPPDIKTKTQKRNFDAERKLSNQLMGFSSIMRNDHENGIVLMRLYGGVFPEDFEFEYDGVQFLGQKHARVNKIREDTSHLYFKKFFAEGEYIIVCTKLQWFSHSSISSRMRNATTNQIRYFSSVLKRDFNLDHTNNYIITNSKWKFIHGGWSTTQFNKINTYSLDVLDNSALKKLTKIRNHVAVTWFLSLEPMFFNALKFSSMPDYWLYLETLLSYKRNDKAVKDIVSSMLLLNEEKQRKDRILATLNSCINIISGPELLNIPYDKMPQVEKLFFQGKIHKSVREMHYAFTEEMVAEFDRDIDARSLIEVKKFYYGILTEAYGNRNFFVHKGFNNNTLVIKLEHTLPLMVARVRALLINEMKSQLEMPFNLLVESLVKKGNELIN